MSEQTHPLPKSLEEFTVLCANDLRVVNKFNSEFGTLLHVPVDVTLLHRQVGNIRVFFPNSEELALFQRYVEILWSRIEFTSNRSGH
jgi:hypothetical protein